MARDDHVAIHVCVWMIIWSMVTEAFHINIDLEGRVHDVTQQKQQEEDHKVVTRLARAMPCIDDGECASNYGNISVSGRVPMMQCCGRDRRGIHSFCVDVSSNPLHCGECYAICSGPIMASISCSAGKCIDTTIISEAPMPTNVDNSIQGAQPIAFIQSVTMASNQPLHLTS